MCCCPAQGDSKVYVARRARLWRGRLRAVGVASPRSRVRPGSALQPNSGSLTTSRRKVPGPHRPSKRHSLRPGVSGTALQPNESCLLLGHRTCFLSEESPLQGVLQRLAGLVLHFWAPDLEAKAPRAERSTQLLTLKLFHLWGLGTPPGWWTL